MNLSTQIPDTGTPIFDSNGFINPVWHAFFSTIVRRTGGSEGVDSASESAIVGATVEAAVMPQEQVSSFEVVPVVIAQSEAAPEGIVPTHGLQADPALHEVASSAQNGFMSATDKAKLDSVSLPVVSPTALLADVVTQNSTADGPILTFVLPASSIVAGTTVAARLTGLITSAASAGTLSVWIKSGATKVLTQVFTLPAAAQSGVGVAYSVSITARTTGTSGTMQIAGMLTSAGNVLGGPALGSVSAALNTTISNTLTIGWNWSAANSGNVATAKNATFLLEKQQ
jgi:hypothetical protein